MITIGQIAKQYGILPSEVVERATTFDIMVTDVYTTWEAYQQNPNNTGLYDKDDLLNAVERVKNGK